MQEAFVAGELQKAQHIQRKIFEYDALISKYGGKAAARALPEIFASEVILGAPRAPLTGLAASDGPKLLTHSCGHPAPAQMDRHE